MLYPIELRALNRFTRGQNDLIAKAGDTTPEAFSRQALRAILFKSLQINANLHLSCLVRLSNILKSNKVGGNLSNYRNVCLIPRWP
jgi:hypothetical protein